MKEKINNILSKIFIVLLVGAIIYFSFANMNRSSDEGWEPRATIGDF